MADAAAGRHGAHRIHRLPLGPMDNIVYVIEDEATAFAGPLLVGWVTWLAGSQRIGMGVIIFFTLGLLLLTVPEQRPAQPPQRQGPDVPLAECNARVMPTGRWGRRCRRRCDDRKTRRLSLRGRARHAGLMIGPGISDRPPPKCLTELTDNGDALRSRWHCRCYSCACAWQRPWPAAGDGGLARAAAPGHRRQRPRNRHFAEPRDALALEDVPGDLAPMTQFEASGGDRDEHRRQPSGRNTGGPYCR
jgi:hypothetical protein